MKKGAIISIIVVAVIVVCLGFYLISSRNTNVPAVNQLNINSNVVTTTNQLAGPGDQCGNSATSSIGCGEGYSCSEGICTPEVAGLPTKEIVTLVPSSSASTGACVFEPLSGMHVCFPFQYGGRLVAKAFNGFIDIGFEPKDSATSSLPSNPDLVLTAGFSMAVSRNTQHLTLEQYFEKNIDVDGILAKAGTFQPETLLDGSEALVFVNPVPHAWDIATDTPPIFPQIWALRLSSSRDWVISVYPDQDNSDFNFPAGYIEGKELKSLGSVKI